MIAIPMATRHQPAPLPRRGIRGPLDGDPHDTDPVWDVASETEYQTKYGQLNKRGAIHGRTPGGGFVQESRLSDAALRLFAREEDAAERRAQTAAQAALVAAEPERDWLTLPEAAGLLGVERGGMRTIITKGFLAAWQPNGMGGWYHVRAADLLAYAALRHMAPAAFDALREGIARTLRQPVRQSGQDEGLRDATHS